MENNKDLEWEKEHFISQIKGDYIEPSRCPRCTGNNLNRTNEGRIWWKGWICCDCQNIVDGCSFYQGRNNGRMQVIKDEIKWLEDFKKLLIMDNPKLQNRLDELNLMKNAILNPIDNHDLISKSEELK